MQLYAAGYLAILMFQKELHYFLPAPSYIFDDWNIIPLTDLSPFCDAPSERQ